MSKASSRILGAMLAKLETDAAMDASVINVAPGVRERRIEVFRSGARGLRVVLGEKSSLVWLVSRDGSAKSTYREINVELAEGASFEMIEAFELSAGQSHGEMLSVNFHGPRASARLVCRCVQQQGSSLCQEAFGGIGPDAAGAVFSQSAKSVRTGHALTLLEPNLRVEVDEATASHGAAHGALDELALHALLSRGFDPEQARSMLVEAFLGEAWTGAGLDRIDRVKLGLPEDSLWS